MTLKNSTALNCIVFYLIDAFVFLIIFKSTSFKMGMTHMDCTRRKYAKLY